jgi:acetylornithine deacetylase
MTSLVQELVDAIEIPSISGAEGDWGDALARLLEARGFAVERQPVGPGRFNVLARAGVPELVFCTHLDTVPPFLPSRVDRDHVHGRGSCDAKGQALAMLAAGEKLLAEGEDRIGFLFTVGEEVSSDGATVANDSLADPWNPSWVIIGEPTDGKFVGAHKGIYKANLVARGEAGHSSQEELPSAIHALVGCTARVLAERWGEHPLLGHGTINIGRIQGGVAANVVADRAQAEVMIRAVEEPQIIEARLRSCLDAHVDLEAAFKCYGPVEFHVPEGEVGVPAAFGTDAPHMPRWGRPLLFGCGSILDAHTDHERVAKSDLLACVERHVRTARELLTTVRERA